MVATLGCRSCAAARASRRNRCRAESLARYAELMTFNAAGLRKLVSNAL